MTNRSKKRLLTVAVVASHSTTKSGSKRYKTHNEDTSFSLERRTVVSNGPVYTVCTVYWTHVDCGPL